LFRGEDEIPVFRLRRLLVLPESAMSPLVVLVDSKGTDVGLMVDKILEYREVVVKSFRSPLRGLKGLGGMTILGDGVVVPILDLETLLP
jgi:two-component system chemotaxis sensor kinase CheA